MFRLWFTLVLLCCSSLVAQEQSVLEISVPDGAGTGVVVADLGPSKFPGYYDCHIVTAAHVVGNQRSKILATFRNNARVKDLIVVSVDTVGDVMVLRGVCPNEIKPVRVATAITRGATVRVVGKFTDLRAKVSMVLDKVFIDDSVRSGDSGGAVFNESGELVGVISGGWFWHAPITPEGEPTPAKVETNYTWPIMAAGGNLIRGVLSRATR